MLFFFAQIAHEHEPTVRELLEKYITEDAKYIIAKETATNAHKETNGQHLHFAVDMTKKEYDAFRNTVLVKKYQLRGKAQKDLPKQYGTVKNVRDEMKMLSYTVKEGIDKIKSRNIDLKTIQEYIAKSYKKEEKKPFQDDLMAYLKTQEHSYLIDTPKNKHIMINGEESISDVQEINFRRIQADILEFWVANSSKPLSRCQLQFYTNLYLQFHFTHFKEFIYEILGFLNGRI